MGKEATPGLAYYASVASSALPCHPILFLSEDMILLKCVLLQGFVARCCSVALAKYPKGRERGGSGKRGVGR